jgi:hypothetical protein
MTSRSRASRQQPRRRAQQQPSLELLEDRLVPSTINWTNRGQASDNFATVFGSNAGTARSVVDTAILEWENVISNFNQVNNGDNNHINVTISMNTGINSQGGSTNTTATDNNGKPISAAISLGRNGAVFTDAMGNVTERDPWYLDSTIFSSAFLGTPTNAFAGYAQAGSAAAGGWDLLEVVTHELGHAMGFYSGAQVNAHCSDTGVGDTSSSDGRHGDYWAFVGTGGFRCLLTAFNTPVNASSDTHGGEHFAAGGSVVFNNVQYNGADDLMTPYYGRSQRRIVSRNDAFVLRDSYGYTVNDPASALGTFYAVLDNSGTLHVRGRQDASSSDVITLDTFTVIGLQFVSTSVSLGTPVPGTAYSGAYTSAFLSLAINSIEIDTGSGFSFVTLAHTPNVPITINSAGLASVTLGTGGSAQGVLGAITLHNSASTTSVFIDDASDGAAHTTTVQDIGGGQGRISGLTPNPINYTINQLGGMTLNTGTGTNTVDLYGTGTGLTDLVGHSGNTRVIIGNGTLAGIRNSVTVTNPPLTSSVVVDDSSDPTARAVGVNTWSVDNRYGQIGGLTGGASLLFKYADTANVTLDTGTGANIVQVGDVIKPLTINSGSSADRINVLGTTAALTVHGSFVDFFNSNTVNVGNGGGLQNIRGSIFITNNNFSTTAVNVDDSGDSTARTGTVTATSVTGLGMAAGAAVNYAGVQLASLTVRAGGGVGNIINVESTAAGMTTTVTGGTGGSTINLSPTAHNLANLAGLVAINGQGGTNTLNAFDQATTFASGFAGDNLYQDHLTRYNPSERTVFTYGGMQSVNVSTGRGDNGTELFGVVSTPAGVPVTVTNAGTSTSYVEFFVGSPLDLIQGPLTIHGRTGGIDLLILDDANNLNSQTFTVTANTVSRTGMAQITYDHQTQLILDTSDQGGLATVNVQSTAAGAFTQIGLLTAGDQATLNAATIQGANGTRIWSAGAVSVPVSVTVDDSSDSTRRTATFSTDPTYRYLLNGLAPGRIYLDLDPGSSMQVLGGSGGNTFNVQGLLAGTTMSLNGGSGTNTLDYTGYTGNVITDLQTGVATGFSSIANIQNVTGASGGGAQGLYNLLIGNGGNVLTGGTGRRNILVAGGSGSTLIGGSQDDLLIGGTTSYDNDPNDPGLLNWQQIAAYWAGTDDFATRMANLASGTGVPLLDATTVTGNGGGNTMTSSFGELALLYTDGADTITGFDPNSQQVAITP